MVARAVARSKLVGITRNSVWFHILASAANEDAEQYVQMARLRSVFSIDDATGSDLDERAAEIVPGAIVRRGALFASGDVVYSRPGVVGTVSIPAGSQVGATDAEGRVLFRTTASATIAPGNTVSGATTVVATVAGLRGNVEAGQIVQLVTRVPGVTGVTNAAKFGNGQDRESDPNFRARLKAFVQAISRGTITALQGFAKNVILADGRRVLYAKLVEPIIPSGQTTLYIDDGTGSVEEFDETFLGSPEVIITSAVGGEINVFTSQRPIRDDGSFVLEVDSGGGFVVQVRGTDYELNPALGQAELSSATYPTGLAVGVPDFDPATVLVAVQAAIQDYINTLDIGSGVIVAEITERAMATRGMFNFKIIDLSGSGAGGVDQVILAVQVARITSSAINLT
jgi:uncharacterized phage protein gp47/JayE